MPAQLVMDTQVTFVAEPMNPVANAYFTASFQEINVGDEATGDYQHSFNLNNLDGDYDFTLDCGSLEPGESVLRTVEGCWVPQGGNYNMNVTVHGYLGNVIVDDDPNAATGDGSGGGGEWEGGETENDEYGGLSDTYHEEAPDTGGDYGSESEGGEYESEEDR